MATTRWTDNTVDTLDQALGKLMQTPEDDLNDESTIFKNWKVKKEFETNREITLNNKKITYNYIKFSYDKIQSGDEPIDDRTYQYDGNILCYFNGNSVNYIINKHTDALRILRKMLNYSGKNEISKSTFNIESDFFIWMINKVYSSENVIETESQTLNDLSLETIKGFKGDTEDLLTKVSASGESVMNIISTLSFLLESKKLNQIKLDLEYGCHDNIELLLKNNGVISTDISKYQGEFEEESRESLQVILYLVIYLEILPILLQAYRSDRENGDWNSKKNIEFLNNVASDLSEKVKRRVEYLVGNNSFSKDQVKTWFYFCIIEEIDTL